MPLQANDEDDFSQGEDGEEEDGWGDGGGSAAATAGGKKKAVAGAKGRTRLCFEQRKEVLELINMEVAQAEIGRRFKVDERTVRRIKNDRAKMEEWLRTQAGKATKAKSL